jgi:hypothetical protein
MASRLNVLNGTIESLGDELAVPGVMTAAGLELPPPVAITLTPAAGRLLLPRIINGPLIAGAALPAFAAPRFAAAPLVLEALEVAPLALLVLVIPGSAVMIDPGLTTLAVLVPVVELIPPMKSVVVLGGGAVLEPDVLWIPPVNPKLGVVVVGVVARAALVSAELKVLISAAPEEVPLETAPAPPVAEEPDAAGVVGAAALDAK